MAPRRIMLVSAYSLLVTAACSEPSLSDEQIALGKRVANNIDIVWLWAHVDELVDRRERDEAVVPPWDDKPLSRELSGDYVVEAFEAFNLEVHQEQSSTDGIDCTNIYVDIPGRDSGSSMVLLTAHYDAWYVGADDNASGVAVLLEAARVLQQEPLTRTVRIIAFDREEEGLIGAQRYLQRHANDDAEVSLIINLDSVAYASYEPGSQKLPPGIQGPDTGDFLAMLTNAPAANFAFQLVQLAAELPGGVPVEGIVGPGDNAFPVTQDFQRSDHAPFWREGIPGLFLTDTTEFRNPHYHKASDTPDTLVESFFFGAAQVAVAATAAFAEPAK